MTSLGHSSPLQGLSTKLVPLDMLRSFCSLSDLVHPCFLSHTHALYPESLLQARVLRRGTKEVPTAATASSTEKKVSDSVPGEELTGDLFRSVTTDRHPAQGGKVPSMNGLTEKLRQAFSLLRPERNAKGNSMQIVDHKLIA